MLHERGSGGHCSAGFWSGWRLLDLARRLRAAKQAAGAVAVAIAARRPRGASPSLRRCGAGAVAAGADVVTEVMLYCFVFGLLH